jgi:hypothetical protein
LGGSQPASSRREACASRPNFLERLSGGAQAPADPGESAGSMLSGLCEPDSPRPCAPFTPGSARVPIRCLSLHVEACGRRLCHGRDPRGDGVERGESGHTSAGTRLAGQGESGSAALALAGRRQQGRLAGFPPQPLLRLAAGLPTVPAVPQAGTPHKPWWSGIPRKVGQSTAQAVAQIRTGTALTNEQASVGHLREEQCVTRSKGDGCGFYALTIRAGDRVGARQASAFDDVWTGEVAQVPAAAAAGAT